jgi:pimeloyl-ACP methyl ester carboxylesterase
MTELVHINPDFNEASEGTDHTAPQVSPGSSWWCCGGQQSHNDMDINNSPDAEFHADSLIKLTHGVTAYRVIEPKDIGSRSLDTVPIIVCLHGLVTASYMWQDIADLLSDFEQGPQARVLVFDFYGRGRSPWTGVDITLDTLVTQTKELMDGTNDRALFLAMVIERRPLTLAI